MGLIVAYLQHASACLTSPRVTCFHLRSSSYGGQAALHPRLVCNYAFGIRAFVMLLQSISFCFRIPRVVCNYAFGIRAFVMLLQSISFCFRIPRVTCFHLRSSSYGGHAALHPRLVCIYAFGIRSILPRLSFYAFGIRSI